MRAMSLSTRARRTAALAFVALSLALTAWLAMGEYAVLRGGARFRIILEERIWISIAILGAFGILGLITGVLSQRRNQEN
jgi:hypothetical protein